MDFHEPGFASQLNQHNAATSDEQSKAESPMGPANPQALNRYSYVLNNPMRYTDPTGHCIWDACISEGITAYVLAGMALAAAAAYYYKVVLPYLEAQRELPRDKYGNPVPDTNLPHTQIGTKTGRRGSYRQTREWGEDGNLVKDTDWTDHGRPKEHTDPHDHYWEPNDTGGTPRRGPARPAADLDE